MPNLNVGLVSAITVFLGIGNAFAVENNCGDCYKCVSFDAEGYCKHCEYDASYCSTLDCGAGKVWSTEENKCVCANVCIGGQDPDTCECVGSALFCENGEYLDGQGFLQRCKSCPAAAFSSADPVGSSCGLNSLDGGANGITDCYYGAIANTDSGTDVDYCNYSDDTGNFVLEQNCHYSEDNPDSGISTGTGDKFVP